MRNQLSRTTQHRGLLAGVAVCLTLIVSGSAAQARPTGRADLRVVAATADAAAAAGGSVYVRVKVRNAGSGRAPASKLRLSLGAAALKRLTPIRALARSRSVTVLAYGSLPASAQEGAQLRVTACADAQRRIKESNERNNCRTSKPLVVTAPTTQALVAALVAAHQLSRGKAALYTLLGAVGDPKLPARFRAPGDGTDEHAAIADVAAELGSLPASDRARLAPYFIPPRGRNRVKTHKARAAAVDCTGRAGPTTWLPVPAAGGRVIVWYPQAGNFGYFSPSEGEAAAKRIAAAVDTAWPKLTSAFQVPKSDADVPCINHGSGSYDIEVVQLFGGKLGETLPYGIFAHPFDPASVTSLCTNTPSFIELTPDAPRFAVAHELMHAIQFSYKYQSCVGTQNAWWDEGEANWAGDYVYPSDQFEHKYDAAFTQPDKPLWTDDYDAWPFWYFLTKTKAVSTLNNVFAALKTKTSRAAVDSAIGGYAAQFPEFVRRLWNKEPVGSSGFPAAAAFSAWDGVPESPPVVADTAFPLNGLAQRSTTLHVLAPGAGNFFAPNAGSDGGHYVATTLGPQAASFQHVTFPDPNLRQIVFTNGMFGRPGQRVDAWMRLADGSWKVADWSADKTTLCRDKADEDVQELYIVSENVAVSGDGIPAGNMLHVLEGNNTCGFPQRYDGTWTRVYTDTTRGTWKETITGSASFLRNSVFPPEADAFSSVPYQLLSGTVSWEVTGEQITDGGCSSTFSGSGSMAATDQTSTGGATELDLEKVTGHAGAPDPEPEPYYYAIRVSDDPQQTPEYTVHFVCPQSDESGTEPLRLPYEDVGWPNPLTPDTPQSEVEKSATPDTLAGHRGRFDTGDPNLFVDDTWSFTSAG
jgi:hypothetical protein